MGQFVLHHPRRLATVSVPLLTDADAYNIPESIFCLFAGAST